MYQYKAVEQAMRKNGGFATLSYLYAHATRIPGCNWGTKTPFASIRRIVQDHDELFFKIKPGLWGLSSEKEKVFTSLGIDAVAESPKNITFDHSYYQGLAVQLGNFRGYQTYIPNQDQNKPFLGGKLWDVSTLHEFPDFTYENMIQRARTIDAIWFNERRLPHAYFEIEHSTDIYNSLLKFVEFQDFRIEFFIVADALRESEYASKIRQSAFKPLESHLHFLDYEKLSSLHDKYAQVAVTQAGLNL
ncbi:MAG: hypothetical protein RBT34_13150 [Anaerolineaceae bacterium]|jgi:hypothetical protein|nr:hypothetical protein [Anaerolineaceae bacterium]